MALNSDTAENERINQLPLPIKWFAFQYGTYLTSIQGPKLYKPEQNDSQQIKKNCYIRHLTLLLIFFAIEQNIMRDLHCIGSLGIDFKIYENQKAWGKISVRWHEWAAKPIY